VAALVVLSAPLTYSIARAGRLASSCWKATASGAGEPPPCGTKEPLIQRDYILRQVHQLAQVLAQVLMLKRADQLEEAQGVLIRGIGSVLGREDVHAVSREDLLASCTTGSTLCSEKAVAVADLLREHAAAAERQRALWLYEAALASGGVVPLDVYERIETLRVSLAG